MYDDSNFTYDAFGELVGAGCGSKVTAINGNFSLDEFLLVPGTIGYSRELADPVFYLQAWLGYKNGGGVADPDGTEWDFYRCLWPGIYARKKVIQLEGGLELCVTGDWMCSVATTFRKGLSLFVRERDLVELFPKRARDGIGGVKTYTSILLDDIRKPEGEQCFRDFYLPADSERSYLDEFIWNAYTRANLIIVPKGLNQARGINPVIKDYWDLTLEHLFLSPLECGELYEYREFFQRLFKEYGRERLFLKQWLNADLTVRMLPRKDPETFAEWQELVREITARIIDRRQEMTV